MNDKLYTSLAERYLFIDSLEVRNRDELDFHSVAVWTVREALEAAYLAGYAAATRAASGAEKPLPTERHTMLGDMWVGGGEAADVTDDPRAYTVTTAPIPETALLESRWQEEVASKLLIPQAIRDRRIG